LRNVRMRLGKAPVIQPHCERLWEGDTNASTRMVRLFRRMHLSPGALIMEMRVRGRKLQAR
jgi:hypothetical protein